MERKSVTCVILRQNGDFICPIGVLKKRFCGDRNQSAICGGEAALMDSGKILHTEKRIIPEGVYPHIAGTVPHGRKGTRQH